MQIEGEAAKAVLLGMAGAMTGASNPFRKANVECPECKADLHFTERGVIHQDPPRRRVKCLACEYKGFHNVEVSDA